MTKRERFIDFTDRAAISLFSGYMQTNERADPQTTAHIAWSEALILWETRARLISEETMEVLP